MRELKFRAWDKENEVYLTPDDTFLIAGNGYHPATFTYTFGYTANENLVLEQFTGLKDKNGKEIYEGDIVRYWSDNYEVKFDEIEDSDITYYYLGWAMGDLSLYEQASMCEVIGNIHENKELLK